MIKGENIYINEFAPRVHNTGHYTLDAAFVSQFENHIRAISGLDLAPTELFCYAGMLNILGTSDFDPKEVLKYGKLYWYGKREVRKRRKMGHINVVGKSIEEVKHKIYELIKIIYPEGLYL
jgi:5-(carboxyamino)imidazole ribonucleotide synthase